MNWSSLARIALSRTPIGSAVGRMPWVTTAYARQAAGRRDSPALQWGVFDSYEAAAAAIPSHRVGGWDNADAAAIWTDNIAPVQPSSYPIFFWLRELLQPGSSLIDLGGSVGLTFYGYCKRTELPAGVRWTVVEVPHLVAAGRKIAAREGADALNFETDMSSVASCDILLAAGALQYMQVSIAELLEQRPKLPRHVLLNKVPFTHHADFWTLHNFGPAITPYRLFNEREFLRYFTERGYELVDRWDVTDMSCDIPFHPDRTVERFTGLYLTLGY